MRARRRVAGSRWTLTAAVAGLGAAALALSSCGAPAGAISDWEISTTTPAPAGDIDSFSWAVHSEPYSLDYAYAFDYPDNQVLANVCESLLRMKPDMSLEPGLAESYANPTPTTWVYRIREGVTFHDGTALTANDVVASLKRHVDPAVGSFWYSVYANVTDIKKTGPMEVTVTTKIPDSQFNQSMGNSAGVIESAKTLKDKGKDYGNSTGGVNCTGPFTMDKWTSGESIHLKRYEGYWDPSLRARAAAMDFVFITDANARINALKSGEVDGAWQVPAEAVPILRAGTQGDVYFGTNSTVSALVVNNLKGPLGDVRVRKALALALDREGILKAGAGGYGEVSNTMTTRTAWGGLDPATVEGAFASVEPYQRDLEKAKALVKEAGAQGKEITIATAPISNDFTVSSQATAAALTEIGLKPKINTVTPNAYTALFSDPSARKDVDLFYTQWYLSARDPMEMFAVLRAGEFSNYGNWDHPEFTKIVNQGVQIMDPKQRAQKAAQAQRIVNDQLPWIPLFAPPVMVYLSDRITGLSPSVNFMYYPWAATLGAR
ncbi:ABC transporter substrate-binding protein [Galactobacter caseinivorans]|uniref:ABC transporter substrate-binding protein n=1 Tax=Galactobacter caseinivorans TaxID=2676123 RepID=A0A496PJ05_9MICC|nr:ABC transporter substrate-binding protein [Galactobacter caseinivorans]RKW70449.1 ABC transporter substrate-binding protein [Galactobacter caseinivorans]